MDHTLVNPNQMCHFGIKVQDNPYDDALLYLMTEDGDFALPLAVQGTNIMADTRTPTEEEVQTCKHITLSSQHPWDTHHVRFPHPSRTVQEEVDILSTIGAVSVDRSNDQESAEEDVMYVMNCIMQRLISSVQIYAAPPSSTTGGATEARAQVSEVEVQDVIAAHSFESKETHTSVTTQDLSERWCIGLGQATETLKHNTQIIVWSAVMPLARRYRTDKMHKKPRLRGEWFIDTLDRQVISKYGNRYGQVFSNRGFFTHSYLMYTKRKAGDALSTFCQEFGVPDKLKFDGSMEQGQRKT